MDLWTIRRRVLLVSSPVRSRSKALPLRPGAYVVKLSAGGNDFTQVVVVEVDRWLTRLVLDCHRTCVLKKVRTLAYTSFHGRLL